MPLEELADDHLVQRCLGCSSTHQHAYAAMLAAPTLATEVPAEARVVALPACAVCGAHEFLVRSSDAEGPHAAPGSYSHLHRLLVDHLHERLAAGRATELGAKRKASKATKDASVEALQRWFPEGLKLAPPDAAEPIQSGKTEA